MQFFNCPIALSQSVLTKFLLLTAVLPMCSNSIAAEGNEPSSLGTSTDRVLQQISDDGVLRIGVYLGNEGLSFRADGVLTGFEVEAARIICDKLENHLGKTIRPQFVNHDWSQLLPALNDNKFDVVVSAVIPNSLYDRYSVRYSKSYLDNGPVICCRQVGNGPSVGITESMSSLSGKSVAIINDPAARHILRTLGCYVPAHENDLNLQRRFPKAETERILRSLGESSQGTIELSEVIQFDDMVQLYEVLSSGEVDAGVIDLPLIWWVSQQSKRWADGIFAFNTPVGPYLYCAATRSQDVLLGELLDHCIDELKEDSRYQDLCTAWIGRKGMNWNLSTDEFLKPNKSKVLRNEPFASAFRN
jgi:ABC-type amino acid transport substrate-binding protein